MWSKFFNRERRSEPRYQTNIPTTVIFRGTSAEGEQPLVTLGTTRDISGAGVAVYVPSFPFTGALTNAERALQVVLALPVGYVVAEAALVRYAELPTQHPQVGYLLAARITDMSPADRAMYREYLQRLAGDSR